MTKDDIAIVFKSLNLTHVKTLLKSFLVGSLSGIVITFYRLILTKAELFASAFYVYIRMHLYLIPLAFILLAAAGFFIGILKGKYHMIGGSGIPQVKGLIMGYFKQNWLGTLLAKFIGGTVSVCAGLSLGREGPSIQLGACVAQGVGNKLSGSPTEKKILIASGASAGLAAAFNAPLAGTMFVLEEIFKYYSPIILLSTMMSAMVADFISKIIFGLDPVFNFEITDRFSLKEYWILILIGIVMGLFGVFYNFFLKKIQAFYSRITFFDGKGKLVLPFLAAGVLGLVFPIVLGGGHSIMTLLSPESAVSFLLLVLVIKFLFSMFSFGSGAPGGIFFPLLVMGALGGAILGNLSINLLNIDQNLFQNFLVLSMVGLFTSIVRAPITGIVLLLEMTGSFSNLLSMFVVAVTSYLVAEVLKSLPIYDYLLENMLQDKSIETYEEGTDDEVLIKLIVHHGSPGADQYVKDIHLPKGCLLVGIKRGKRDLIPNGDTLILPNDTLILLVHAYAEADIRQQMEKMMQGY